MKTSVSIHHIPLATFTFVSNSFLPINVAHPQEFPSHMSFPSIKYFGIRRIYVGKVYWISISCDRGYKIYCSLLRLKNIKCLIKKASPPSCDEKTHPWPGTPLSRCIPGQVLPERFQRNFDPEPVSLRVYISTVRTFLKNWILQCTKEHSPHTVLLKAGLNVPIFRMNKSYWQMNNRVHIRHDFL
jgi:hypothetical protein